MKYRESGMPDEKMWDTFFNPEQIMEKLDVDKTIHTIVDIGCGYGTFLLPAAKLIAGKAVGIDIDQTMIEACKNKIQVQGIQNIELLSGDISAAQTMEALGQYKGSIDYISLFNILHCEQPLDLFGAAHSILNNSGKIGVIHWNYEETPRGPSMDIRPTPDVIEKWAVETGFVLDKSVDLPPYHYGLVFKKR